MPADGFARPPPAQPRPRVGVSSCLLGFEVRYNGQHKRDPYVVEQLGRLFDWVSVCPEVEVGMGVPRESVRLVRGPGGNGHTLMLGNDSGADWTDRMNALARVRVQQLADANLAGYILKAESPSCGRGHVKLYRSADAGARVDRDGVGLFAAALAAQLPDLPVEDEARLQDPTTRETFIERVLAYHRRRALTQP